MAVTSLKSNAIGLRPGPGSHVLPTQQGRAATSQTWVTGAVLIRSSGELIEASADPTANIAGVAAEDVTSAVANEKVRFWPAFPGVVFEGTLEDQTNEDHALVETNLYTDFALQVDDDGIWYIDENDTTATGVVIVGVKQDDDIVNAVKRARVYFVFLNDVTIYDT